MKTQSGTTRHYKMTVAGQLFKHLGLQMYSGAVPAISELISNSYDAMARNVWITIPTERHITQEDKITVRDDGHGMNFEECHTLYLHVGRDRRSNQKSWTKPYNNLQARKVQGRKGIGKLAGFGIANFIDIRTVKDGEISHFLLDFDELTKSSHFTDNEGYNPPSLPDDGTATKDNPNTIITLSRLKIGRTINEKLFKQSIARRLLVLDDEFTVYVNDQAISREEIPFQFRFPQNPGEWEIDKLDNKQEIKWWAGFCKNTISNEERRGLVVYVRGKLAQTPWFFDLSGGVWGQHGMQYLTGEIQADFLDEEVDLIATDRGTIRWEDPMAVPLKEWGRNKIKKLLEEWSNNRRIAKYKSPKVKDYLKQAENLPEKERIIFKTVVDRICSIPQLDKDEEGRDITDELVKFVYNALTNRSFLEAIRQLNTAPLDNITRFNKILAEWDIIELVNAAHVVKGRVEIIRRFRKMIKDQHREKPDMQDYVRKYSWLINPQWTTLVHEKTLDGLISKSFDIEKSGSDEGRRRLDFFCLGDKHKTAYVVEVKRPGKSIGRDELDQLRDYVLFLRGQLQENADAENRRTTIQGLLIADNIRKEDHQLAKESQKAGFFDIRTWDNLLISTEILHEEFLQVVKERAPANDPRITALSEDFSKEQAISEEDED